MNTPQQIHEQLKAAALPLMEHYQEDLTKHDLASITRYPGTPFIHGTRSTGTYIEHMHPHDSPLWPAAGERIPYLFGTATREHILKGQSTCIEDPDRGATHTWHYYNGHNLYKITYKEALKIWKHHEQKTLTAWKSQKGTLAA